MATFRGTDFSLQYPIAWKVCLEQSGTFSTLPQIVIRGPSGTDGIPPTIEVGSGGRPRALRDAIALARGILELLPRVNSSPQAGLDAPGASDAWALDFTGTVPASDNFASYSAHGHVVLAASSSHGIEVLFVSVNDQDSSATTSTVDAIIRSFSLQAGGGSTSSPTPPPCPLPGPSAPPAPLTLPTDPPSKLEGRYSAAVSSSEAGSLGEDQVGPWTLTIRSGGLELDHTVGSIPLIDFIDIRGISSHAILLHGTVLCGSSKTVPQDSLFEIATVGESLGFTVVSDPCPKDRVLLTSRAWVKTG
jgi:hypothetical protein